MREKTYVVQCSNLASSSHIFLAASWYDEGVLFDETVLLGVSTFLGCAPPFGIDTPTRVPEFVACRIP